MERFPCPYLGGLVELSEQRERHISDRHPGLLPEHRRCIGETLADPDEVRRSVRLGDARLFARCYDEVKRGKYVVVVLVSEAGMGRHWVITSYMARKLAGGSVEWQRS